MGEQIPLDLASSLLFQFCAADSKNDQYWAEFIRRFSPLFIRSITFAWRKYSQEDWPTADVSADLLQDIYTAILKDGCRLLRQFRGVSDAEAEAYLAHVAINQVVSYLRARGARKRQAELVSFDALISADQGGEQFAVNSDSPFEDLAEHELVESLQRIIVGPNSQRDILVFLLNVRDGWTASEIAHMKICDLKDTSIANLLVQMKARVKKYYSAK
jgi:DNA-directed RNA polymerase specialized sigma24 family protein